MKRIKKVISICLPALLLLITPHNVNASQVISEDVRTTINIKANVPSDFNETIAFILEQESTQVRFQLALKRENNYTGSLSVVGNKTYKADAKISKSEKYKINLAEKYEISGESVDLSFDVSPIVYSIENQDNSVSDTPQTLDNTHGEEIDPTTGLITASIALKDYTEKVSFMQEDNKFLPFLTTYSGAMFKKYYLEADPMNTEDQWDGMSEIERFNYYVTFIMPYTKMMNFQYESENKFIEELVSQKNMLSQIENGDNVYNALVEIWKWHYKYWKTTGTFYNFYNYYDGTNSKALTTSETVKLSNKDKQEISNAQDELKTEITKEKTEDNKRLTHLISRNIFSIIIFLIVGLAFLSVYLYNRKKNIDEI